MTHPKQTTHSSMYHTDELEDTWRLKAGVTHYLYKAVTSPHNCLDVPFFGSFDAARFIVPYVKVLKYAAQPYSMQPRSVQTSSAMVYESLVQSITNVYRDVMQTGFIDASAHHKEHTFFRDPHPHLIPVTHYCSWKRSWSKFKLNSTFLESFSLLCLTTKSPIFKLRLMERLLTLYQSNGNQFQCWELVKQYLLQCNSSFVIFVLNFSCNVNSIHHTI